MYLAEYVCTICHLICFVMSLWHCIDIGAHIAHSSAQQNTPYTHTHTYTFTCTCADTICTLSSFVRPSVELWCAKMQSVARKFNQQPASVTMYNNNNEYSDDDDDDDKANRQQADSLAGDKLAAIEKLCAKVQAFFMYMYISMCKCMCLCAYVPLTLALKFL
ncbi:unnamed protein product [Ceratitis capitata]|uniref:(Mediterranean fruit fly) hypothetical protein n=1 Tax=Ceratitis capitata TaxID=7213 RepID=A0A811U0Y2_CERCA|nr:unnamed protein product [Ceratitis capitata]